LRIIPHSANGAEYSSQGASAERSEARRAWIIDVNDREALKERNTWRWYFALSVLSSNYFC